MSKAPGLGADSKRCAIGARDLVWTSASISLLGRAQVHDQTLQFSSGKRESLSRLTLSPYRSMFGSKALLRLTIICIMITVQVSEADGRAPSACSRGMAILLNGHGIFISHTPALVPSSRSV